MQEQRPILLTYSSVWSHRVLESIAEPYAQRVINRLNIREAGTQDDLEGMYQLVEEITKLFTPEAKVL